MSRVMLIGNLDLPSCTSKDRMSMSSLCISRRMAHLWSMAKSMDDLDNELARSIDDHIDDAEALPFERVTRREMAKS